jgi:hypothetical protein
VNVGVQATRGRDLDYLPSRPWTAATPTPPAGQAVGPQGADTAALQGWLDDMAVPWWPAAVLALGLLAGAAGGSRRLTRRGRPVTAPARLAGLASATGLALAATAVLGDGYFEIAKHVWPLAYLVDVTAVALLLTVLAAVVGCRHGVPYADRPA